MTTLTHSSDADVQPDVRTEAHSHRHRKPSNNPAVLAFLLLAVAVSLSGLFVITVVLASSAHAAPAI